MDRKVTRPPTAGPAVLEVVQRITRIERVGWADHLKERLLGSGYNIRELAQRAKIGHARVLRLLHRDNTQINAEDLAALCCAAGIDEKEILR